MELEQGEESLGDDILNLSTADIQARTRLLDNEVECAFLLLGTHFRLAIKIVHLLFLTFASIFLSCDRAAYIKHSGENFAIISQKSAVSNGEMSAIFLR